MFGLPQKYVDYVCNIIAGAHDIERRALLGRIEGLKADVERERRRADLAVDALLQANGKSSVMPERHPLLSPEERQANEARRREMEAVRAAIETVGHCGADPLEERAKTHEEEIAA